MYASFPYHAMLICRVQYNRRMRRLTLFLCLVAACCACARSPQYDLIIRHGMVYDGTDTPSVVEDVAINGDRIAAIGTLGNARGRQDIDATGLAVSPGFI